MARKVRFENLKVEDVKSKLDKLDDPLLDFPLLKFIQFSIESLKHLIVRDNGARGTAKGNGHFVKSHPPALKEALRAWTLPFCCFTPLHPLSVANRCFKVSIENCMNFSSGKSKSGSSNLSSFDLTSSTVRFSNLTLRAIFKLIKYDPCKNNDQCILYSIINFLTCQ